MTHLVYTAIVTFTVVQMHAHTLQQPFPSLPGVTELAVNNVELIKNWPKHKKSENFTLEK